MLLDGKNALITGGSQGIGAAASLELAREGANVCLTYRQHDAEANEYADAIRAIGRQALALQCDISSFSDAERVVKQAVDEFGRLDILVNNAGMNWDGVSWKMTEEQWDRVLEVNLKGYFNVTRHIAPLFKDQKYGKIINITSINGLRGKFGQTNYSASKAGIIGFTKALAKDARCFWPPLRNCGFRSSNSPIPKKLAISSTFRLSSEGEKLSFHRGERSGKAIFS
jgi:3-oxoacyl-[acyl-carrier protein] reductase